MTTYCTVDDLKIAFGEDEIKQLTDREKSGEIDTAVTAPAIARASKKAEGYCRGKYVIPLNPVDADFKGDVMDVTRYYLYENRTTEEVKDRYEEAVAHLKDISRGVVILDSKTLADEATGATGTNRPGVVRARSQIFTEDLMAKM